MQLVMNW